MNLLVSKRKYVIALQYRKEHALGSTEYSDLSNKALKYYEEEKDKDAINSVLEYASLPEQISYLKRKDDMQNQGRWNYRR